MRHKPSLAGERVTCSKCGGQYFEPTDPLPGVKPQIAPPAVDEAERGAPLSSPAPGGPHAHGGSPAAAAVNPAVPVNPAISVAGRSPSQPAKGPAQPPKGIEQLQPQEMVAELERRGLHALLIAWPPAAPLQAGLLFSSRLGREGADKMILEVAFQLISARWPELHQLLNNYRKQLN
jgi:hypothetical protein